MRMRSQSRDLLRRAGEAGVTTMLWTLLVAAKPAPAASDDDWTMPAIVVGVMVFIFFYNVVFGKGGKDGSGGSCGGGGDGCGGGCGGD